MPTYKKGKTSTAPEAWKFVYAFLWLQGKVKSGERYVVVSLKDKQMDYLSGKVIDGRIFYPAMGYIVSCALSLICVLNSIIQGLRLQSAFFTLINKYISL